MNCRILSIAVILATSINSLSLPIQAVTSSPNDVFLDIMMTPERNKEAEAQGQLRADAQEAAEILNIAPLIEKLRREKYKKESEATIHSKAVHNTRLLCLWKIMIGMQEVRKVVANINYDMARSEVALDTLTRKKNMTTNLLNAANFLQFSVSGVVRNSLALNRLYTVDNIMSINEFGLGTIIPSVGLVLPSLLSRKVVAHPNMLAHVLNPSYRPADADVSYLWKFMHSKVPGHCILDPEHKYTRRELLIKHWEKFADLDCKDENRLKQLTALPLGNESVTESIRIITQRLDLLADMRIHIEEFDGSLYELYKAISSD
jgi:hypothetical protein